MANNVTKDALVERIEMGIKQYTLHHIVDEDLFGSVKVDAMFDHVFQAWRFSFVARWPAERLAAERWPSDWREAFKERWFPKWALKRWPVRYTELDIDAIYSRVSVPDMRPRFYFYKIDRQRVYPE